MVQHVECRSEIDLDHVHVLPGESGVFKGHDQHLQLVHGAAIFSEALLCRAEESVTLCKV